jgi:ribulose 1,5-bisphosphate carboxylase large subunit-like protein
MPIHDHVLFLDVDQREAAIRHRVYDESPFWSEVPPDPDALVATYFLRPRTVPLNQAGKLISYHMTTGAKHATAGSLLDRCTGRVEGVLPWNGSDKVGLVRVAFPTKLFEHADGKYYTTDILHLMAGEGVCGLWEFAEAKLLDVKIPPSVLRTFPGPAYGCAGVRELTHWPSGEPAFGTILKPTAGITDDEVAALVEGVAGETLFLFVKEDENLFPNLAYCPVVSRARKSAEVVKRLSPTRGGLGLIFAPHITSPPHLLLDTVKQVLETGINGLMFSEQFTGGSVRAVRDLTAKYAAPPVLYGHNSGISTRTNQVWREVLDFMARLDGIDFRQTAPVTSSAPLLRPQGLEWRKCEEALTKPAEHIKPVMIARAGGLDQGNIIVNLADVAKNLPPGQALYLAGSAINSILDDNGHPDPKLGAKAMREALDLWRSGEASALADSDGLHAQTLYALAQSRKLTALQAALKQRYGLCSAGL